MPEQPPQDIELRKKEDQEEKQIEKQVKQVKMKGLKAKSSLDYRSKKHI